MVLYYEVVSVHLKKEKVRMTFWDFVGNVLLYRLPAPFGLEYGWAWNLVLVSLIVIVFIGCRNFVLKVARKIGGDDDDYGFEISLIFLVYSRTAFLLGFWLIAVALLLLWFWGWNYYRSKTWMKTGGWKLIQRDKDFALVLLNIQNSTKLGLFCGKIIAVRELMTG